MTVAPCDVRGRVEGPAVEGVAEFIGHDAWPAAVAALRRTYGLRFTLLNATSRFVHRLTRPPGERHEILRIRPA